MNLPGKRLLLGSAVAVATLGVGGIAYAATNDPAPETGYVTIEDGATPSPGYGGEGPQGNGSEGSGTPNGTTGGNGADCPDKNGTGQGPGEGQGQQTQPSQPSQPETQPSQPQPQPSQPEQSQSDQAENA